MDYSTLTNYLSDLLQQQNGGDTSSFATILPAAIDAAWEAIHNDVVFLNSQFEDDSQLTTPGNRSIPLLSLQTFPQVVQSVALVTPSGSLPPQGTQNWYQGPVSIDFLNAMWPNQSATAAPGLYQGYWAMYDSNTVVVAPTPDAAYGVSLIGITRPPEPSLTNENTYVGDTYPTLLVAACMRFLTGWQRDFGAQSDDPKMAVSWETQYQTLMQSAFREEQRRRGSSEGWTAYQSTAPMLPPQAGAQPPRR